MRKINVLALIGVILFSGSIFANEFSEAIKSGKVSADLRFRYEGVDQDGFDEDAMANTIRLRLGYTTAAYKNFKFHVDIETIQKLGDDYFNSTNNGNVDYPVVADPIGSELNQAYLLYTGIENSIFKIGRQRIILDNARFIGNVGWRQNEQTYDAYTYVYSGIENGTLILSNVQRVNRIFGDYNSDPIKANIDANAYVIHYNHKFSVGSLSAYGHFIELQNETLADKSHQNLGIRFAGKKDKFLYTLEYAKQSDYSGGADIIDADYFLAEAGTSIGKFVAKAGYESLGGNGAWGFYTPLATLHAFNGWSDMFLNTPKDGLKDVYLMISTKFEAGGYPFIFKAFYHNFQSDSGSTIGLEFNSTSIDYGTELDVLFKMVLSKKASLMFKYADYNADEYAEDTTKMWLMASYKF